VLPTESFRYKFAKRAKRGVALCACVDIEALDELDENFRHYNQIIAKKKKCFGGNRRGRKI
jgi:hypothetical protein